MRLVAEKKRRHEYFMLRASSGRHMTLFGSASYVALASRLVQILDLEVNSRRRNAMPRCRRRRWSRRQRLWRRRRLLLRLLLWRWRWRRSGRGSSRGSRPCWLLQACDKQLNQLAFLEAVLAIDATDAERVAQLFDRHFRRVASGGRQCSGSDRRWHSTR